MNRVLFVLVALALVAPAAFADITVTTSVSILAANMNADGTMTTYAKGTKYRADTNVAGQMASWISALASARGRRSISSFRRSKALGDK